MMEVKESTWKEKADLLQRFLKLTKWISDLLAGADVSERLKELEYLIEERGGIIERVPGLETKAVVPPVNRTKEEEKQKWLCGELLSQIQEMERRNVDAMSRIMDENKKQMRSNRQSRDTIGAYSRQMQETTQDGMLFNKTK